MTATKGRRWRPSAPANWQRRHRVAALTIAPLIVLAAAAAPLAALASDGGSAQSRRTPSQVAYHGAAGARARLDGNALLRQAGQPIEAGLEYSWSVVSEPQGARLELQDASSSDPTVTAATLGRYELQLQATMPGSGDVSARTTSETVTYDAAPPVPVSGAWIATNPDDPSDAFQVGTTRYAIADFDAEHPARNCPALLLLDARTLTPLNTRVVDGRLSVDELDTCDDDEQLNLGIRDALDQAGVTAGGQAIAILISYGRGPDEVSWSQHDATYIFNPDLSVDVGDNPGIKSGWYHESGESTGGGLSGWMQREYKVTTPSDAGHGAIPIVTGQGPFEFSSGATMTYRTYEPGAAGSNTMTFSSESADATQAIVTRTTDTLPAGATNGFQLVVLDDNGHVVFHNAYADSNAVALATELDRWEKTDGGATVLLQSIGRPQPSGTSWNSLAAAVDRLYTGGAAADALLRLDKTAPAPTASDPNPGSFALVASVGAGAQPDPLGNAPTSIEASALDGGAGELAGLLQTNRFGVLAPTLSGPSLTPALAALKGISQGAPTAAPSIPGEDAVLRFLSTYSGYGFDKTAANACYAGLEQLPASLLVRASYCNANLGASDWSAWADELDHWADGSNAVPRGYLDNNPDDRDGATFKRVAGELATEFRAVADVRNALGINGTVAGEINQVSNLLGTQALHGLDRYRPTAAQSKTSFNLWRLVLPTVKLIGHLPGGEEVAPVADLMEIGQIFLEADQDVTAGESGTPREGNNQEVLTDDLKAKALTQLSDAQLALGPLLDRLLTDPAKLVRVAQNFAGTNLDADGKGFTDPNGNDIYAADWVKNDAELDTDVVAMVQGLNQGLASDWVNSYYSVWQLPTADRHTNQGPQQRSPGDTWNLNCDYYGNAGRLEWHVFAKNPQAVNNDGQWPTSASYVPLDQSTPTAIWTLVQKQDGDNPWQAYYTSRNGAISKTRHISPPDQGLLDLLSSPTADGGYGITPAHLFMKGIATVHPLPATDSSSFYASQDCGY